jgi:hypothetical protein
MMPSRIEMGTRIEKAAIKVVARWRKADKIS